MSILEKIRHHTRPCHQELESKLDLFNRIKTKKDYIEHLKRQYSFWVPLEKSLFAHNAWREITMDLAGRHKAHLIGKDLLALGSPPQELGDLTPATALPSARNFGQVLGACYVMEGSTLGGQVVAARLKKQFGETMSLNYYGAYGDETGKKWREFTNFLNDFSRTQNSEQLDQEIVNSAVETFEKIGQWLCH